MNPIKAIVMTCDKYRALTDHMIFKYAQLWPDHPFQFRVPYQELAPTHSGDRVHYRQTPVAIKATVLGLLEDLDDEELIYWCIDDKYPIRLDTRRIEQAYRWIAGDGKVDIGGLLFCRARRMWDKRCLTGDVLVDDRGNRYLERSGYQQIWIHQFVRVGVIRHMFMSFPDEIPFPRHMDTLRNRLTKPPQHRLWVTRKNLAIFGESAVKGALTRNCYRSMKDNGLQVPDWESDVTKGDFVVGTWKLNTKQRLRYLVGRLTGQTDSFY